MAMDLSKDHAFLLEVALDPVKSSNVLSVGYDEGSRTIVVEYHNGYIYGYLGCSPEEYKELREANSKGQFVSRRLMGQKETVRVA